MHVAVQMFVRAKRATAVPRYADVDLTLHEGSDQVVGSDIFPRPLPVNGPHTIVRCLETKVGRGRQAIGYEARSWLLDKRARCSKLMSSIIR
jgi:hypothetical protein